MNGICQENDTAFLRPCPKDSSGYSIFMVTFASQIQNRYVQNRLSSSANRLVFLSKIKEV